MRILHEIYGLVIDNTMGFDRLRETSEYGGGLQQFAFGIINRGGVIDEFFFTIIYVITVYIIALSCFKLIDRVPDSILRWAGAGVKSFGDTYQDPAAQLTQYAAIGGFVVGERAIGGVTQLGKAMGQGIGSTGPVRNFIRSGRGTLFADEVPTIERARGITRE